MPTAITTKGFQEAVKKLTTLQDIKRVKPALTMGAFHLKGKLASYPTKVPSKANFKTDKQRRYFFWALKQGIIEVPYRRGTSPGSETLGRRWGIQIDRGGLQATVGNNASYGKLVQDRDQQTGAHKRSGWPTVQGVAETEGPKAMAFIVDWINGIILGR